LRTHTRTSGASGVRREPRYVVGVRNRRERQYRHERCYGASHRHGRGGYASLSRERVRRSVAVMISKRRTRTNKREERVHPQRARERSTRHSPYSPYSDNRLTRERRDTHAQWQTHKRERVRQRQNETTRTQRCRTAPVYSNLSLSPAREKEEQQYCARAPEPAAESAVEFSALGFRGMEIVAGVRLPRTPGPFAERQTQKRENLLPHTRGQRERGNLSVFFCLLSHPPTQQQPKHLLVLFHLSIPPSGTNYENVTQ